MPDALMPVDPRSDATDTESLCTTRASSSLSSASTATAVEFESDPAHYISRASSSLSSGSSATAVELDPAHTNSLRYSTASSADGANRNAGRAPKINEVEADLLLMWLEHERPRWHKAAAEAFKEIDVERWQQATDMAAVAPPPSPAPSCDTLTQADGASSYNPNYIYPRGHRFRQPTEVLEERKLHAHWEQRPPAVDARLYLHPEMDPAVFHQPPAAQSIRPTWSNFFAGSSTAGICSEWRVRSPLSELDAEAPVGPL